VECFFRNTETERRARVEPRPARGEEVTMLVARPTTLSGVFDVDALPATGLPLNRTSVRPDDIALSAEPAASTG